VPNNWKNKRGDFNRDIGGGAGIATELSTFMFVKVASKLFYRARCFSYLWITAS
jgi:hypothetical protein